MKWGKSDDDLNCTNFKGGKLDAITSIANRMEKTFSLKRMMYLVWLSMHTESSRCFSFSNFANASKCGFNLSIKAWYKHIH